MLLERKREAPCQYCVKEPPTRKEPKVRRVVLVLPLEMQQQQMDSTVAIPSSPGAFFAFSRAAQPRRSNASAYKYQMKQMATSRCLSVCEKRNSRKSALYVRIRISDVCEKNPVSQHLPLSFLSTRLIINDPQAIVPSPPLLFHFLVSSSKKDGAADLTGNNRGAAAAAVVVSSDRLSRANWCRDGMRLGTMVEIINGCMFYFSRGSWLTVLPS